MLGGLREGLGKALGLGGRRKMRTTKSKATESARMLREDIVREHLKYGRSGNTASMETARNLTPFPTFPESGSMS